MTHHISKQRSALLLTAALFCMTLILASCGEEKGSGISPAERQHTDSIVRTATDDAAFSAMQKRMKAEGNTLGEVMTLRLWGDAKRNSCLYDEALKKHDAALKLAQALNDSVEWVQALNNIGTDYRRMGILPMAHEYHQRALVMARDNTDTAYVARKNIVISLNGLANVYLTLGNYERADSILRLALAGEKALGSDIGLAINYANIGAIFEKKGRMDSAQIYYERSMRHNTNAGNLLGIALCHTFFGGMYEKQKMYDKALAEYEKAYDIMSASIDDWHTLNALIALVGIYYAKNDDKMAENYLAEAEKIAKDIESNEHLAEIYRLHYNLSKRRGDNAAALAYHEKATELKDGIINMEDVNRMQSTSLSIEQQRQEQLVQTAKNELSQEKQVRNISIAVFAVILLLVLALFLMTIYTQRVKARSHEALKKLSSMRETFYTNITHEFRTPLTVILGLSEELEHGRQKASDVAEKAHTIHRQGNRLLALINQLLDIAKIKSAVGNADWRCGDITTFISMIVDTYRDYARSRNIELTFVADKKTVTDFVPDYVEKVMSNLLSNALKFTPEYGKVGVKIWESAGTLHADVADTGEGMDKQTLSRIFEPFYQAETESQHIGTGLGLALVKQIIDSVGGELSVESEPGHGTTFHISVPVSLQYKDRKVDTESEHTAVTQPVGTLPATADAPDDTAKGNDEKRILIVEDNHDVAEYIGSLLCNDYAVYYARNGVEGLERARQLIPDLIVSDLMMPAMGGLEMCRNIRTDCLTSHIPVIILTAKVTEEDRIKGVEAGADAYLTKPFSTEELRMRIKKLLELRQALRKKFSIAGSLPVTKDEMETKDTKKADSTDKTPVEGVLQQPSATLTPKDEEFLVKVTDTVFVMLNTSGQADVNAVASKMCMSYSQFYRKFSAITDSTPAQYIQRIKVKRAQRMLERNPEMSLREVADRCGFNDYTGFVRAFRNVSGVTPSQYAKRE